MGGRQAKSFLLWFVLIGCTAGVLAQGRGRMVRVRKTGEFGQRIVPISTSYQPPPRERSGSDPYFETSETRRSPNILGLKKPSQSLQLPIYTPPDQEAEESAETVQGYAYPNPSSGPAVAAPAGYDQKPPILEFPVEVDEPGQQIDEAPVPVVPGREAELPQRKQPLRAEAEESIGAEGIGAPAGSPPVPVRDTPSAEASCDENDHSCWPHGYKSEIPGDAGTDYPILSEIVDTSFDCDSVQYSGYYADTDEASRCQMFHVCLKGNQYRRTQKWSFLCPNGTLFSQHDFVCVWWNAAPECNSGVVNELSLRNAELGWDNLTEAEQQGGQGFDVRSAMSSLANTNLQSSSSNAKLNNRVPEESNKAQRQSTRVRQGNGNPYRVPVKVNTGSGARTKLKEVSHNSLQGQEDGFGVEHFGEESETFETSLRHQSEARHKTKSGSALAKSESEAYEQKSVPESVSPFIVSRGSPNGDDDGMGYGSSSQGIPEENPEEGTSVVMMSTQQRSPDGSEGFAEVPVRMQEGGYRYPNPTATPGPAYLPPRKEYTTTTNEPPTSTLSPEENSDAEGGYVYQTPEYSQQLQDPTTTEENGYRYPNPTTTEQGGYNYDTPSTTTEQSAEYNLQETPSTTEQGYKYEVPSTTEQQDGYKYEAPSTTEQEGYRYPSPTTTESSGVTEEEFLNSSPVYEEERNAGYAYESTPRAPTTIAQGQEAYSPEVTTVGSTESSSGSSVGGGYLPPKAEGGYSAPQVQQSDTDILSLPNNEGVEDSEKTPEVNSGELSTNAPASSAVEGNEVTGGSSEGGYGSEESTSPGFNIPTPSSDIPAGANLDTSGKQDKVNEILEQIKAGGAEVRDENGNKIDFAELQKLILSTPTGQLALQKADASLTTVSSATSTATEPSTGTTAAAAEEEETPTAGGYEGGSVNESPTVSASPTLETVQPIEDFVVNRRVPSTQGYSNQPQESYFTNNRLVSSRHENYEISAPAKEYENHSVDQNSIDVPTSSFPSGGVRNSFETSGYSGSYESQRLSNQVQPQGSISQNFGSLSQPGSSGANSALFQTQQPQVTYNSVRPSVPQPQQYYQQQQQQQQSSVRGSDASAYYTNSQNTNNLPTQNPYFQPQAQQVQNQGPSFFQTEPVSNEYLPPVSSTSQSSYRDSTTQDKFRSAVALQRDLSSNIQLQPSYNVPIPQASSINRKLVNPTDIKIVPALFVHQHTRVENPDGSPASSTDDGFGKSAPGGRNYPQSSDRFGDFNIQSSRSAYIPYASQTVPVRVRAPRLNRFTRRDVLPKVEQFTAEDGRTKEEVERETRKYQRRVGDDSLASQSSIRRTRRRSRSRSGPRGDLELVSNNDQSSLSNVYPGKNGGVSLTYN